MFELTKKQRSKYRMVTVIIPENDPVLIEDLESWEPRLYRIPNIGIIAYRGFLRFNKIEHLGLFTAVNPLGHIYEVYDEEGMTYDEHRKLMNKIGRRPW